MFSEDEKKAIKKIEEFRDYYAREDIHKENFNSNENYEKALSETKQLKKYFETVLNLVTKLEKGNKKLKDNNKSLLKKLRNRIKEVKKLTKYALYKKEFAILNRIIKEKDKQITELNEYLERISKDLDNVAIDQVPIAIAELKYNNELKDKQIDLMAEVMFKNNTAQLIIEYGIENKEQIIKEFEKLVKEKGE